MNLFKNLKFKSNKRYLLIVVLSVVFIPVALLYISQFQSSNKLDSIYNGVVLPEVKPVEVDNKEDKVENEWILNFKTGTSTEDIANFIKSVNGTKIAEYSSLNSVLIKVNPGQEISNKDLLNSVEPDYIATALDEEPKELSKEEISRINFINSPTNIEPLTSENISNNINDPDFKYQWGVAAVKLFDNNSIDKINIKDQKNIIAVIDSGICIDNPDLISKVIDGWDFVENDNIPQDDYNHGCGVAGIIAANINNKNSIAGISPNSVIMPLKVLDKDGKGTYSNLSSAIIYAVDNNAKIINISLGGYQNSKLLEDAINYALKKGVKVVAAAGNTSNEEILFPAKYNGVYSVGSIDRNNVVSNFSSQSHDIRFWAPGESIISLSNDGSTKFYSGTSFAAPYISGLLSEGLIDISNNEIGVPTAQGNIMPVNFSQKETSHTGWGLTNPDIKNNLETKEEFVTSQSSTDCVTRYSAGWWYGAQCYVEGVWQRSADSRYAYQIISQGHPYYFFWWNGEALLNQYVRAELTWTGQYSYSVNDVFAINRGPLGWIDGFDTNTNILTGWSFDPDSSSTSINVYVFIDGAAGSGATGYSVPTNKSRSDVNSTYGISGVHGYNWIIPTKYTSGTHSFYVYGVDTSNGNGYMLSGSPLSKALQQQSYQPTPALMTALSSNVKTYGYFLPEGYNSDIISEANQNISYLPHKASEDSVNSATGFLDHTIVDLSYPEISGVPFEFRRSYNSDNKTVGILSSGWRTSFDMRLVANNGGDNALWSVLFPDGHGETFQDPDNNYRTFSSSFTPINPESKATLYRYSNNDPNYPAWSFKYTDAQTQQTFYFNGDSSNETTFGLLTKITYVNGDVLDFTYNSNGKVTSVVESLYGRRFDFQYDSSIRLTKISDRAGRSVTYTYDYDNSLSTVTSPINGVTTYTYVQDTTNPAIKRIKSVADANNVIIENSVYDSKGRVISLTDGNNNTRTYTYTSNSTTYTTKISDPLGNVTTQIHNANYYLIEEDKPNGDIYKYEYDSKGNKTKDILPDGKIYQYTYDSNGNRNKVTYPNNYFVTTTYNSYGKPLTITEGNSDRVKTFTYNANNNLIKTVDALGGITTYEYNANGLVIKATDANGSIKSFTYDTNGYLAQELDQTTGSSITYTNDVIGNKLQIKDALNHITTLTYDKINNILTSKDAKGNTKSKEYDLNGFLIKEIDEAGIVTTYARDNNYNLTQTKLVNKISSVVYDKNNNKIKEISPDGSYISTTYDSLKRPTKYQTFGSDNVLINTQEITYNKAGLKQSEKDGNGNITSYTYDTLGHLASTTKGSLTKTSSYDFWGNLISETDWEGNRYDYTYDKLDRLILSKNPLENQGIGLGTSYTYDALGNLIKITDSLGQVTQQFFNTNKQLVKVINPKNYTATYLYDKAGNLTKETNFAGEIKYYTYDANNNIITSKDPLNYITKYEYDSRNLNTKVIDPQNNFTTTTYDDYKRKISQTDKLGNIQTFEYDLNDNLIKSIDREGTPTLNTYDALKNLTSVTVSKVVDDILTNIVTINTYDANGNILSTKDGKGNIISYTYDSFNRVTKVTNPNNSTKQTTYSPNGNILTVTNENGAVTKFTYDILNRKISEIDAENNTKTFAYDSLNRLINESDFKNQLTNYTYDALGNLTKITDRNAKSTSFTYDKGNRITKVLNPNTLSITTTFDKLGRKIKQITTGTGITTPITELYTYDEVGNLTTYTDSKGNITNYTYDKLGQALIETDSLGKTTSLAYNKNGNIISATNKSNNTTLFNYDPSGKLITKTDSLNITLKYIYDANGNLIKSIDGNNQSTIYTYDSLNRILTKKDPTGVLAEQIEYDLAGNIKKKIDGQGNSTTYIYDLNNRVKSINDSLNNTLSYLLDSNGNITQKTNQLGGISYYTYDKLDRVTLMKDEMGYSWKYTYDNAGNVLSLTNPKNQIEKTTYDALSHKLTVTKTDSLVGSVVTKYTYDTNGNLIQTTDANNHIINNTYDALNRLITSTNDNSEVKSFTYDASGNILTSTDENGNVTKYEYDNNSRKVKEIDPLNNATLFNYDNNNNLISQIDPLGNIQTKSYDALNRVTEIRDGMNNKTIYGYDNNGNLISEQKPSGTIYNYTYDALNRKTQTAVDSTILSKSIYDALGREVSSIDALNNTTNYTYDALGRMTKVIDAAGSTTTYLYDQIGNVTKETNANNASTSYSYNTLNNLIKVTNPLGKVWTYDYDKMGNITREIDPNGIINIKSYDVNNKLLSEIYQNGAGETLPESSFFEYDKVGNLIKAYKSDTSDVYTYNADNKIINASNSKGYSISYTYDANGNQTSIQYPDSQVTNFTYDSNNRVSSITNKYTGDYYAKNNPIDLTTLFSYDSNGNLIQEVNSDKSVITKSYNNLDQVTGVNNYVYSDNISSVDYYIGKYTYTLDANGNKLKTNYSTNCDKDSSCASDKNFTSQDIYTYDSLNRVKSVTHSVNDITNLVEGNYTNTYTYDAAGNRKGLISSKNGTQSNTVYTYNLANQLTSDTGWNYTYDSDGNRVSKSAKTSGEFINMTYNAAGQLSGENSKLKNADGSFESYNLNYIYDALGRRISKVNPSAAKLGLNTDNSAFDGVSSIDYVYNGKSMDLLSEYTLRVNAYDNPIGLPDNRIYNVHTNYFYGDFGLGQPTLISSMDIAERTPAGPVKWNGVNDAGSDDPVHNWIFTADFSQQVSFYQRDGLDSVVGSSVVQVRYSATDVSGSMYFNKPGYIAGSIISGRSNFDEFGNRFGVEESGAGGTGLGLWSSKQYSGQIFDIESGYSYYGSRFYDPSNGTWTKQDSYLGSYKQPLSRNRYAFVNNNPVNRVDLYGFAACNPAMQSCMSPCNSSIQSCGAPAVIIPKYSTLAPPPYSPVPTPDYNAVSRVDHPNTNYMGIDTISLNIKSGTPDETILKEFRTIIAESNSQYSKAYSNLVLKTALDEKFNLDLAIKSINRSEAQKIILPSGSVAYIHAACGKANTCIYNVNEIEKLYKEDTKKIQSKSQKEFNYAYTFAQQFKGSDFANGLLGVTIDVSGGIISLTSLGTRTIQAHGDMVIESLTCLLCVLYKSATGEWQDYYNKEESNFKELGYTDAYDDLNQSISNVINGSKAGVGINPFRREGDEGLVRLGCSFGVGICNWYDNISGNYKPNGSEIVYDTINLALELDAVKGIWDWGANGVKTLKSSGEVVDSSKIIQSNPLEGSTYSSKVQRQMSNNKDLFHAFPESVDGFVTQDNLSHFIGNDKKVYKLIQLSGGYAGKEGTFEYILDANNVITHRFFNVNK